MASPGHFESMRVPVRRGRTFTDRDDTTPATLTRLVLRDGMRLALAGGGIGRAGAVGLAHELRHLLHGMGSSSTR